MQFLPAREHQACRGREPDASPHQRLTRGQRWYQAFASFDRRCNQNDPRAHPRKSDSRRNVAEAAAAGHRLPTEWAVSQHMPVKAGFRRWPPSQVAPSCGPCLFWWGPAPLRSEEVTGPLDMGRGPSHSREAAFPMIEESTPRHLLGCQEAWNRLSTEPLRPRELAFTRSRERSNETRYLEVLSTNRDPR